MPDLSILKDGEAVGAIKPDGFYTDDPALTALLQECFDGQGAVDRVGGETEDGGMWEGMRYVKPGDNAFEDAFQATLSQAGYELAVAEGDGDV